MCFHRGQDRVTRMAAGGPKLGRPSVLSISLRILLLCAPLARAAAPGEVYVDAYNTLVAMLDERFAAIDPNAVPQEPRSVARNEGVTQADLYALRTRVLSLLKSSFLVPIEQFQLDERNAYGAFPPGLRIESGVMWLPSVMDLVGDRQGNFTKVPSEYTDGETVYGANFSDVPLLWIHFDELFKVIDAMRCTRAPNAAWVNADGGENYKYGDIADTPMNTWTVVKEVADANYAASGECRQAGAGSWLECWTYGFGTNPKYMWASKKREFYSSVVSNVLTRVDHRFHFYNYAKVPPYGSGVERVFATQGAAVSENSWTRWDVSPWMFESAYQSEPLGDEADPTDWCAEPAAPWYFRYKGYFVEQQAVIVEWGFHTPHDWRPPIMDDSEEDGLIGFGCDCVDCIPTQDPVWLAMLDYPCVKWPLGLSSGLTTAGLRVQAYLTEYAVCGTPQQMFSLDTAVYEHRRNDTEKWEFGVVKRPFGAELVFSLRGKRPGEAINLARAMPYRLRNTNGSLELHFRDRREVVHRFGATGALAELRATVNGMTNSLVPSAGAYPKLTVQKNAEGVVRHVTSPMANTVTFNGTDHLVDDVFYYDAQDRMLSRSEVRDGSRLFRQWDADGSLLRAFRVAVTENGATETLYGPDSAIRQVRRREAIVDDATSAVTTVDTMTLQSGTADEQAVTTEWVFSPMAWGYEPNRAVATVGAESSPSPAFSYYTNRADSAGHGRLALTETPDGSWVHREYDATGRVRVVSAPFKDSSPDNLAAGRRETLFYCHDPALAALNFPAGDTRAYAETRPRLRVETCNGRETARTYYAWLPGRVIEKRCLEAGAAYDAPSSLVTTTFVHTEPPFRGRPRLVEHEDGTLTTYEYFYDDAAEQLTTIRMNGAGANGLVTNGVLTETLADAMERPLRRTESDVETGILLSDTLYERDAFGRALRTVNLLDRTEVLTQFGCCGPERVTDAGGLVTHTGYDALGRVVSTTRLGVTVSHCYDAQGNPIETRHTAAGVPDVVSRSAFDAQGRLVWSSNAVGAVTTVAYTNHAQGGLVVTETYPDGSTRVEESYRDGQLKSLGGTAVSGRFYEYGCDESGEFVVAYEGADTNAAAWVRTSRDRLGRTVAIAYPDGYRIEHAYDALGRLCRESDGFTVALHAYGADHARFRSALDLDASGGIELAGPDRVTETRSHYAVHEGVNVRETVALVYGSADDAVPATASVQRVAIDGSVAWSSAYGRTTVTHIAREPALARRTETVTRPDGTRAVAVYEQGRVTTVRELDDGGGLVREARWAYDIFGRVHTVSETSPCGTPLESRFEYDAAGNVAAATVAGGGLERTTRYEYDARGRRVRVLLPDGAAVTNSFDARGNLVARMGGRTYPVRYAYDAQGRMTELSTFRAGGAGPADVTRWTYDSGRGWLTAKTYADGSSVSFDYFANGAMRRRRWARGVETAYAYDAAGGLVEVRYSDGTPPVQYERDRLGREVAVTDGIGVHSLTYTVDGQLASASLPQHPVLALECGCDGLGRRVSLRLRGTDRTVAEHTYGYDHAGRLAVVSDGTVRAAYGFAADGRTVSGREVLVGGVWILGETNRLNGLGRLIEKRTDSLDGVVARHEYEYDAADQRVRCGLADGSGWQYRYDALGQLVAGRKFYADGSPAGGAQFEYSYDTIGNRVSSSRMGGLTPDTRHYTANALNQYTEVTEPGQVLVSGRAEEGAVVTVGLGGAPARVANRYGEDFWQVLEVDNRAGGIYITNVVKAMVMRGSNELVRTETRKSFVPQTPRCFTYDADGNLLCDGLFTNTWNAENRLIATESLPCLPPEARTRLEYDYDYGGRLTRKRTYAWSTNQWEMSAEHTLVYDGWNPICEFQYSSIPTRQSFNFYLWGLDMSGSLQGAGGVGGLLGITRDTGTATNTYLYSFDGNGNIVNLVDASDGSIAATYEYDPFGGVLRAIGPMASDNPVRWSTKHTDDETGLVMYPKRPYAPTFGRWLGRDRIGENGGLNLYGFVQNNPVLYIDPYGFALYAFDGTGTRYDTWTHISILYRSYDGERFYLEGVGSRWYSKVFGGAFGLGGQRRVSLMYKRLVETYEEDSTIDIIGFSRGAALARDFANEIYKRGIVKEDGTIIECIPKIRFVGLFDTVGSFGWPGNDINIGVSMDLPSNVERAAQAVAEDERRGEFPLTPLNQAQDGQVFAHQVFRGDHSDIGGGHLENQNVLALQPLFYIWRQGRDAGVPFGSITIKEGENFEMYLSVRGENRPWPYVIDNTPHDLTGKLLYTDAGPRGNLPRP